jgi:Icc-related predicted phosphoesterase
LPPEQLLPGRLIVVGDIHGCLKELNQLLDACDYDHGHDNLIFAGDIINKGPNSVEVSLALDCGSEAAATPALKPGGPHRS